MKQYSLVVICSALLDLRGLNNSTIFVHFNHSGTKKTVKIYALTSSPMCKDMSENGRVFKEVIFDDRRFTGFATTIRDITDLAPAFPNYELTYINSDVSVEPHLHGDYLF